MKSFTPLERPFVTSAASEIDQILERSDGKQLDDNMKIRMLVVCAEGLSVHKQQLGAKGLDRKALEDYFERFLSGIRLLNK